MKLLTSGDSYIFPYQTFLLGMANVAPATLLSIFCSSYF